MKISVSLPARDVEYLDELANTQGTSRSSLVARAIQLLRSRSLGDDYAAAWAEWSDAGEDEVWDPTASDGLGK